MLRRSRDEDAEGGGEDAIEGEGEGLAPGGVAGGGGEAGVVVLVEDAGGDGADGGDDAVEHEPGDAGGAAGGGEGRVGAEGVAEAGGAHGGEGPDEEDEEEEDGGGGGGVEEGLEAVGADADDGEGEDGEDDVGDEGGGCHADVGGHVVGDVVFEVRVPGEEDHVDALAANPGAEAVPDEGEEDAVPDGELGAPHSPDGTVYDGEANCDGR